jgi:hypothetical protein
MASFKNLEMASALSNSQYINIRKTMFGLSQKAVYEPTQSTLKPEIVEFTPDQGARLEQILSLPKDKLIQEIQTKGFPKSTPVGQYRLECCVSADQKFVALQLFRFSEFSYKPVSELLTFVDEEGAYVSSTREDWCIESAQPVARWLTGRGRTLGSSGRHWAFHPTLYSSL